MSYLYKIKNPPDGGLNFYCVPEVSAGVSTGSGTGFALTVIVQRVLASSVPSLTLITRA